MFRLSAIPGLPGICYLLATFLIKLPFTTANLLCDPSCVRWPNPFSLAGNAQTVVSSVAPFNQFPFDPNTDYYPYSPYTSPPGLYGLSSMVSSFGFTPSPMTMPFSENRQRNRPVSVRCGPNHKVAILCLQLVFVVFLSIQILFDIAFSLKTFLAACAIAFATRTTKHGTKSMTRPTMGNARTLRLELEASSAAESPGRKKFLVGVLVSAIPSI